jgi:cellobiose-specific phosphotransferase system component IIA
MISFQSGAARLAAVDRQLRDRDTFLAEVKDQLLQAQAYMKAAHDKQHRLV